MQVDQTFLALYALAFLVSALGSLLVTPAFIRLAERLGAVDQPGPRKIHARPVPLLGGSAVFLVYLATAVVLPVLLHRASGLDVVRSTVPPPFLDYLTGFYAVEPRVLAIAAGAAAMFAIGLVDDLREVSVGFRLALEFIVASVVTFLGVQFRFAFACPEWVQIALTIVWIVGVSNALNLIDGLDGLAAGIATIAATLLALVMAIGNRPLLALLLATMAGNLAGFLRYNFHPARIFLGSSGSILIGYLLAVACLFSDFVLPQSETLFPILVPVLVLGVPLYDTASVVVIRLLTRRPLFQGDRNHVHHRLLRLGMGHRSAVLFLYLFSFVVGVNAILLVGITFLESLVVLVQIVALFCLFAVLERVTWRADRAAARAEAVRQPEQVER